MKYDIIEGYIEKIYGYAINHTYSREEADELAQAILFTAVRGLSRLRDENKFIPSRMFSSRRFSLSIKC